MTDLFFSFSLSQTTFIAFFVGAFCVFLSYMILVCGKNWIARFVLRDIITIVGLGVLLPFVWIKMNGLSFNAFGFLGENWTWAILANIVLASLFATRFYFTMKKRDQLLDLLRKVGTVIYLMVGVLFETLFFYGFLRQLFEDSFGIIPALLLTSSFYSLHHVGLEEQMKDAIPRKEYTKLFFVGILYSTVFRIFNSALAIFPFFLGAGVIYDLIIQKENVHLSYKIALITLILMIMSAVIIIIYL